MEWMEPFDDSAEAKDAAQRALDVMAGLVRRPPCEFPCEAKDSTPTPSTTGDGVLAFKNLPGITYLHSPMPSSHCLPDHQTCESNVALPTEHSFGVNHYSTRWLTGKILEPDAANIGWGGVEHVTERDGQPIGPRGHNGHPYNVPWGFHSLLKYIDKTWAQPQANVTGAHIPIIVTENGYACQDEKQRSIEEVINDEERIDYFAGYLQSLVKAKKEGVPIIGYMAWSLME